MDHELFGIRGGLARAVASIVIDVRIGTDLGIFGLVDVLAIRIQRRRGADLEYAVCALDHPVAVDRSGHLAAARAVEGDRGDADCVRRIGIVGVRIDDQQGSCRGLALRACLRPVGGLGSAGVEAIVMRHQFARRRLRQQVLFPDELCRSLAIRAGAGQAKDDPGQVEVFERDPAFGRDVEGYRTDIVGSAMQAGIAEAHAGIGQVVLPAIDPVHVRPVSEVEDLVDVIVLGGDVRVAVERDEGDLAAGPPFLIRQVVERGADVGKAALGDVDRHQYRIPVVIGGFGEIHGCGCKGVFIKEAQAIVRHYCPPAISYRN